MKQKSFFIKSGLLLAAFIAFSGYGRAQGVNLEKFVPVTDGTVNMEFPYEQKAPNGKKYDRSLSAQIDYYKAFIGQKILFYGNYIIPRGGYYTFPYAAKRKIVNLYKPITYTENGITYAVNNVSTRRAYDFINGLIEKKLVAYTDISNGLKNFTRYKTKLKWAKQEVPILTGKLIQDIPIDFFDHFFVLKDVLTKKEADKLSLIGEPQRPTVQLSMVQKELQKLQKKKDKKGKLTDQDEQLYEILNRMPLFYSMRVGKETMYSETINNDTLIDFTKPDDDYNPIVFLMEDVNGDEYLMYRKNNRPIKGYHPYITENHLNYLKDIYENQDFAQVDETFGQIEGETTFRCEKLLIIDEKLKAQCRCHQTQEIVNLDLWIYDDNYWLKYDGDKYQIVVL